MSTWLTIKQLSFQTNKKSFVLDINHLELQHSTNIITGNNGTGKSTLLNLIFGTLKPKNGTITLNETIKTIDFIDQNLNQIPYLSVKEYCFLSCYLKKQYKKINDSNFLDQFNTYAKKLHIHDFNNVTINQLSRGQQQRVAVLKALITKPNLILADEPTSAQDKQGANYIYETLINFCNESKSKLIAIEHQEEYFHYAKKVISIGQLNKTNINNKELCFTP